MKTHITKGMGFMALALCLGLVGSVFAAESAADIDRQLQRTAQDLDRELDRATSEIHNRQRGMSTADAANRIDNEMSRTVNQANNELDLATRQIHYQQQRDQITQRMNRVQRTSSEYQRLEQDLRRLDNQIDQDTKDIIQRINDSSEPVYNR